MKLWTKCKTYVEEALNPVDLYSSQRFVLCLSFWFGLIPYKLVGIEGKRKLQSASFGYIFAVVYIIVFFFSFINTLTKHVSFVEYFVKTGITEFGGMLNLIISFISITSVYMSSLWLRKKIKRIFTILSKIDKKLLELGIEINHRSAVVFNIKCFASICIAHSFYGLSSFSFLFISDNVPGLTVWVTQFLPFFIVKLLIFTFANFARLTCIRFVSMNKILSKLCGSQATNNFNEKSFTINPNKSFKESQNSSLNLLAERKLVDVIKDTCSIHDDLCDTCFIAEEYFALKMLTIVTIGFLIIVFNGYYVLEIAFGQVPEEFKEESVKFLVFLTFQIGMNVLGIICIIQSSCAISNENEKSSIYVHKIMNTTGDEYAKEKLLEFSLQLIHRKVKFTALNLFPLDRTLLFTIAGAATTYLIILFQFSNQNQWTPIDTGR